MEYNLQESAIEYIRENYPADTDLSIRNADTETGVVIINGGNQNYIVDVDTETLEVTGCIAKL